ncbi:MAG: hypothetical protein KC619_08410 [Myxococcales bacterium]|nr:hypothetical protein [Myxococcales bacterium]
MNASIQRVGLALLVLCTLSLAGCGSLVREVLGRPDPQTAVTVRCGEGDEEEVTPSSGTDTEP